MNWLFIYNLASYIISLSDMLSHYTSLDVIGFGDTYDLIIN